MARSDISPVDRKKTHPLPPAPRKTLLEWIETDDGDQSDTALPAEALHARILLDPIDRRIQAPEPLQPPAGLRLAPLG